MPAPAISPLVPHASSRRRSLQVGHGFFRLASLKLPVPLQRRSPLPARHGARVHPTVVERISQLRTRDSTSRGALAGRVAIDAHPREDIESSPLARVGVARSSRELLCRVFIEGSLLLEGLERKSVGLNCVILSVDQVHLVISTSFRKESWLRHRQAQEILKGLLIKPWLRETRVQLLWKADLGVNLVLSQDLLEHPVLVRYRLRVLLGTARIPRDFVSIQNVLDDLDQILDVRLVIWEGRSLNVRVQDHGRRPHVGSHGVHDDVHA
mmetsp:Transcript_24742/g.81128  ORF Transcript_24742/g.81128 Transcript_24742/m.81128 type:complete len:267 (-) Transcript_24742:2671-3471(-)